MDAQTIKDAEYWRIAKGLGALALFLGTIAGVWWLALPFIALLMYDDWVNGDKNREESVATIKAHIARCIESGERCHYNCFTCRRAEETREWKERRLIARSAIEMRLPSH